MLSFPLNINLNTDMFKGWKVVKIIDSSYHLHPEWAFQEQELLPISGPPPLLKDGPKEKYG